MDKKKIKIYIAGHNGLVGSALKNKLLNYGYSNLIYKTHNELDLESLEQTSLFFKSEKPDIVFLAAAKVGGIRANDQFPVDFIQSNLAIQLNVIKSCYENRVKRLFFLGSSCIYPKNCPQPINENYLLTGELEQTNRPYALAKISGIEMCWSYNRQFQTNYLAVMPTNLYGDNDNYDLNSSHVLPAIIRKLYEAKINNLASVTLWGSGKPKREFLHSDDLAEALIFLMNLNDNSFSRLTNKKNCPILNIGSGIENTIEEIASIIKKIIGYKGDVYFDQINPDGTMRKLLSSNKINKLGWNSKIDLFDGITVAYKNFISKI